MGFESVVVIILACAKVIELLYKILKHRLFKFKMYFSNSSSSTSTDSS